MQENKCHVQTVSILQSSFTPVGFLESVLVSLLPPSCGLPQAHLRQMRSQSVAFTVRNKKGKKGIVLCQKAAASTCAL